MEGSKMLSTLSYKNVEVVGNGSVYENKSGKQTLGFAFYYRTKDGKKNRKVVTASTEEDLRKKAIIFLEKLDKEQEEQKKEISQINITSSDEESIFAELTFKEVGDMWYEEYSSRLNKKRKGISYSTLECRDLAYRTICKRIGDMSITDITQSVVDDLIEYYSYKSDGTPYSRSYVDKLQQTFHKIMGYAKENGLYHYKLETTELSYLEKADTDARFLDREQVAEIKTILKGNDRYSLVVDLIMATGLRQEELFALTLNDFIVINEKTVELHVNNSVREIDKNKYELVSYGKTDRSRRVISLPYSVYMKTVTYFNEIVKKEISYEKKLREQNGTVGLLFADKNKKVPNKRTFERSLANYIKRQLKKLNKTLDYEVTLHMFRHSYASLMAENLPVEVVAKLLGDTIATTEKNYYSMSRKVKQNVSLSCEDILKSIENICQNNMDKEE